MSTLLSVETREIHTGELVVPALEACQRDTAGERREQAFHPREQRIESVLSKQNTTGL